MLIPAIIKKNEILEAFKRYYYTDDMMYETGGLSNWLPNIQEETENGRFQYAIVNSEEKLIGYLDYNIDWYTSCASRSFIFFSRLSIKSLCNFAESSCSFSIITSKSEIQSSNVLQTYSKTSLKFAEPVLQ